MLERFTLICPTRDVGRRQGRWANDSSLKRMRSMLQIHPSGTATTVEPLALSPLTAARIVEASRFSCHEHEALSPKSCVSPGKQMLTLIPLYSKSHLSIPRSPIDRFLESD